jgi:hypothetical protein
MEEVGNCWSGDTKKEIDPSRAQTHTSAAPASKYKARFSLISERELEGETISTQISGARSNRISWLIFSRRSGASQATSMALTPPAVERGHSDTVFPADNSWWKRTPIWIWRWP